MSRLKLVSCGCCSNGCVCWNHQNARMAVPARTCELHETIKHSFRCEDIDVSAVPLR